MTFSDRSLSTGLPETMAANAGDAPGAHPDRAGRSPADPASNQDAPGHGAVGARSWYAVLAQPGREQLALTNLHRQNFEAFAPRRWETRRTQRGFKTVLRPVFPRYLFVALDLERQHWRSVNGTYGVSRLVSFAERPTPLPPGVGETLLASLDTDGVLLVEQPLVPGETVRLVRGPFASQLGVLERLDSNGRVRLLLDLLSGKVALSIDRDSIERVSGARGG